MVGGEKQTFEQKSRKQYKNITLHIQLENVNNLKNKLVSTSQLARGQ